MLKKGHIEEGYSQYEEDIIKDIIIKKKILLDELLLTFYIEKNYDINQILKNFQIPYLFNEIKNIIKKNGNGKIYEYHEM